MQLEGPGRKSDGAKPTFPEANVMLLADLRPQRNERNPLNPQYKMSKLKPVSKSSKAVCLETTQPDKLSLVQVEE